MLIALIFLGKTFFSEGKYLEMFLLAINVNSLLTGITFIVMRLKKQRKKQTTKTEQTTREQ